MKKIITQWFLYGSILSLLTVSVVAQTVESPENVQNEAFSVKAKVDRRIELLTIVARLAGFEEYSNTVLKTYSDDIDRHFEKHKNHPAILYAKELRKNHGVGYDAVMTMAVHLSPPPNLEPRVTFSDDVIDGRWGSIEKAGEFVKLLQQFYKDTDCESFFKSQTDLYSTAEQRFQKLLDKVDFDWYRRFYGEMPEGSFMHTKGNYGPSVVLPNGKKDVYSIVSTTQADDAGLPVYNESRLPTIIHEFNHSFINHLFFANRREFEAGGEKIFDQVREKLKLVGYGNWESTVIESLVGAAVIRYTLEHETDPEVAFSQIVTQRNRGFIWINELVTLLGAYENSKKNYPNFRSFFPLFVGYFNDLSKRIEREAKKIEQMSPQVVSISPFANEAQDVNPNITRLTINFDKPLDTEVATRPGSISQGKSGKLQYPITKVIGFNETGTAMTLEVKLKPDWEYEFVLTGSGFKTKNDGYPLQNYVVNFKTGKPATGTNSIKSEIKANEIISAYLKAIGGYEKLKQINTLIRKGTYIEPGYKLIIPTAKTEAKRPNFRLVGNPDEGFAEGFDGASWEYFKDKGVFVRTAGDAEAATRRGAEFDESFIDYKKKRHKVSFEGLNDLGTFRVYDLKVFLDDGWIKHYYIDVKTNLLVGLKKAMPVHAKGDDVETITYISNYKLINGVLFPFDFVERKTSDGKLLNALLLDSIEANVEIENKRFNPPIK